jgi:hypothetical protein
MDVGVYPVRTALLAQTKSPAFAQRNVPPPFEQSLGRYRRGTSALCRADAVPPHAASGSTKGYRPIQISYGTRRAFNPVPQGGQNAATAYRYTSKSSPSPPPIRADLTLDQRPYSGSVFALVPKPLLLEAERQAALELKSMATYAYISGGSVLSPMPPPRDMSHPLVMQ